MPDRPQPDWVEKPWNPPLGGAGRITVPAPAMRNAEWMKRNQAKLNEVMKAGRADVVADVPPGWPWP
jgi:hypothetical protein